MIDLRLLREDPDGVRRALARRGPQFGAVLDEVIELDQQRRAAVPQVDALRAEQKRKGRLLAASDEGERALLREELTALSGEIDAQATRLREIEAALDALLAPLPNLPEDEAPDGGEDDAVELRRQGTPMVPKAPVRDHLELGELLGAIDMQRGAKVSGARFGFLTGPGALLELALVRMAVDHLTAAGFTFMIPPVLVREEAMYGTGYLPTDEQQLFRTAADDLYLAGTSEVPLVGFHAHEVLDAGSLPRRYVGFSTCFRREAGSYGRDTRGIFRVHQFDKVEMVAFVDPAQAKDEHLRLLAHEEALLQALELPYRVVDVAVGDLGGSAARKFDCEAWIPSQETYRELTSTSNCSDYQSRRIECRVRGPRGTYLPATLNGTAIAIGRTIVALLENHQQPDGSVRIPAALQPYYGSALIEPAVSARPAR